MSGASKRANGRVSGPVLQSVFLAVIDHSGRGEDEEETEEEEEEEGGGDGEVKRR